MIRKLFPTWTERLAAVTALLLLFGIASFAAPSRGIDDSFFSEGGALDQEIGAAAEGGPASEEASVPPIAVSSDELISGGIKVLMALSIVTALIIGLNKLLKKNAFPGMGRGLVHRIAVEAIAPNQYLHVVEIGGKILVLGMNEKGLTRLAEFEGESADRIKMWNSKKEAERSDFASFDGYLKKLGDNWISSAFAVSDRDSVVASSADRLGESRKRLREAAL